MLVAAILRLLAGMVAVGERDPRPRSSLIPTLAVAILCYAVEILAWVTDRARSRGSQDRSRSPEWSFPRQYALVIGATIAIFALLEGFFDGLTSARP